MDELLQVAIGSDVSEGRTEFLGILMGRQVRKKFGDRIVHPTQEIC